jgi:hypothetical protein
MRFSLFLVVLLPLFAVANAADVNGYTAQYECRAGSANCNVDVVALGNRGCDQIVDTQTAWSSINWSNNTICLTAGDHSGKGVLTIPSSAGGGANYKVLRYYRSSDNNDQPWHQGGNQAKILGLKVNAANWLIHRLTFPGVNGTGPSPRVESGGGGTNQIFNRILVEGNGAASNYYGYSQNCNQSGYNNITVQNSVFRNVGPYAPIYEVIAIDLQCGNNLRAVNNEIYDWVAHPIQLGRNEIPTLAGIVVENNDLYVTTALHTNGGAKAASESPLSIKVAGTQSSPVRIIHNRFWGARLTDLTQCCNGTVGDAIGSYDANEYVLLQNNILFDSQVGMSNVGRHNSIIGNIFWKIKQYTTSINSRAIETWHSHGGVNTYELYLNSFIDVPQYAAPALSDSDSDARCNVFLSSGQKLPGSPSSSAVADFNAFYDSTVFSFNGTSTNIDRAISTRGNNTNYSVGQVIRTTSTPPANGTAGDFLYMVTTAGRSAASQPAYCTSLGCTTQDGAMVITAIRGPHAFYRKLQTGAERLFIPYARVHTSAPEAHGCPSNYAARSGIGVNNVQ